VTSKGKGMLYSSLRTADKHPVKVGVESTTPKNDGGTTNG